MADERVSRGRQRGVPAGERRLLLREQAATFGLFVCKETDTPTHLDDDSRHWFVCVEQPRPPRDRGAAAAAMFDSWEGCRIAALS